MWSASSSTVIWTSPRSQWPCWIRSSSRPGQAMRMSTPRLSAETCGPWPTPPKTVWRAEAGGLGERAEGGVDLADELAGRREDQRAGPARRGAAALGGQPGDDRQRERVGLAGAGAAAAEQVLAGERVGQRRGLDRGGNGDAGWPSGRRAGRWARRDRRSWKSREISRAAPRAAPCRRLAVLSRRRREGKRASVSRSAAALVNVSRARGPGQDLPDRWVKSRGTSRASWLQSPVAYVKRSTPSSILAPPGSPAGRRGSSGRAATAPGRPRSAAGARERWM